MDELENKMRLHRCNLEQMLDREMLSTSTTSRGLALARKDLDAYAAAETELRREMDSLKRENARLRGQVKSYEFHAAGEADDREAWDDLEAQAAASEEHG